MDEEQAGLLASRPDMDQIVIVNLFTRGSAILVVCSTDNGSYLPSHCVVAHLLLSALSLLEDDYFVHRIMMHF